jgi:hypothetical protein
MRRGWPAHDRDVQAEPYPVSLAPLTEEFRRSFSCDFLKPDLRIECEQVSVRDAEAFPPTDQWFDGPQQSGAEALPSQIGAHAHTAQDEGAVLNAQPHDSTDLVAILGDYSHILGVDCRPVFVSAIKAEDALEIVGAGLADTDHG